MTATFTTLDPLNAAHNPHHELQTLILAEVFLAGGPCWIHRLWSEMYERQKSIDVGMLLFCREIMAMEKLGLLEHVEQDKTEITTKGQIHLLGLLLLGLLPDGSLKRLESKGLKLASTQNILDSDSTFSAASSGEHSPLFQPISSVSGSHPEASAVHPSCFGSSHASTGQRGKVPDAVNESGRVALKTSDVADVSPVPALAQGGEIKPSCSSPLYLLASEIVDIVERAEQERLEEIDAEREGVMTQMSGYRDPAEDRTFA